MACDGVQMNAFHLPPAKSQHSVSSDERTLNRVLRSRVACTG